MFESSQKYEINARSADVLKAFNLKAFNGAHILSNQKVLAGVCSLTSSSSRPC